MVKTGIVTQVNKNIAYLMTSGGEFVKVRSKGESPFIGAIFSGELYVERKFYRLPAIAASILICTLLGSGVYSYVTPVAAITIDINPSVKLDVNRWNKIIKATALNDDGKIVLDNLNLTHKSPEEALGLIVDKAEKDNFINDEYKNSDKVISVQVVEKKENQIDLTGFESAVKQQNLKVSVTENVQSKKEDSKKTDKIDENGVKNQTDSSSDNKNIDKSQEDKGKDKDDKDKSKNVEEKDKNGSNAADNKVDNKEDQKHNDKTNESNGKSKDNGNDKKESSQEKKEDKNNKSNGNKSNNGKSNDKNNKK